MGHGLSVKARVLGALAVLATLASVPIPRANATTISWTLSSDIPLSDGGTLNGFFGIIAESGYSNGTNWDLKTAGGSTNFNMDYTAEINAFNPNVLTVQFVAPNPAYSSLLQLTFLYSLIVPRLDNPIVGGLGGPSFECEGFSCTEANTRFVGEGFANANPLPGALPLFLSGGGVIGLLAWRRKRRASLAA
jgi:hypothetical protein